MLFSPAGKSMALLHDLVKPGKYNIDYLPRSLAKDVQEISVGIILSGTDDTLKLKSGKGITMLQAPKTEKLAIDDAGDRRRQ